jgi:hypothetical protein
MELSVYILCTIYSSIKVQLLLHSTRHYKKTSFANILEKCIGRSVQSLFSGTENYSLTFHIAEQKHGNLENH